MLLVPAPLSVAEDPVDTIDFNRDVRPILSNNCFACHGPDQADRAADLRLDTAEGIAGVADEIPQRIVDEDVDVLMPPPGFHKPLSREQIATLKRWVDQGAVYAGHW
ncbi:MAG: c-type cytochrome domain-containing protein, partial [Planctomycetota bacterium]